MTSQMIAWTAQIQPTGSSLTPAGIAAGPTNDVVVADMSGGTVFEQHRWDLKGTALGVHQDPIGSYTSTTHTNLIIDAANDLFYGFYRTGLVQGANIMSDLAMNRISPTGQVVFAIHNSGQLYSANPQPTVELFFAADDASGNLHTPFLMSAATVYSPGVYCYGSAGNNLGVSASSFIGSLSSKDVVRGSPDAGLFVAHPAAGGGSPICGTTAVPAGGGIVLMRTDGSGTCVWSKVLSVPTAAVKAWSFKLGADGFLTLAVVYSGTINLGNGAMTSTGTSSLAIGRYTVTGAGAGSVIWAKSFGGAGSSFALGSVDTNVNGITIVTGGYAGTVSFGGANLPSGSDTFLTVLDAAGNLHWQKTVTVGASGSLIGASGPCGLAIATNSTSVDLGNGPLSTVTPPNPATIGVAAIAF